MENITGPPVDSNNYLETRLYLVDELREMVRKTSVIIDAPRRFGKTSIVKELIRQEKEKSINIREFNIFFFELEGEESINNFCLAMFNELLKLYKIRNNWELLKKTTGDYWNVIARRIGKIDLPDYGIEIREHTRNHDFKKWKENIEPLIFGLNSLDKVTLIVFDEFPDMLMNFKNKETDPQSYKAAVDSLTSWLRTLRQRPDKGCKYQFVFCGSVNLRKTLEDIGSSKRIGDLETLKIPTLKREEAVFLIRALMEEYKIEIEEDGLDFITSKIMDGSPYFGQIIFKALRDEREKRFTYKRVMAVYDAMIRGGNHILDHFHSRLEVYLSSAERECGALVLKHLCVGAFFEKELFDAYFYNRFDYEVFQSIVNRLIYEGYLMRDTNDDGKIRFLSPLLKDWWACKGGVR